MGKTIPAASIQIHGRQRKTPGDLSPQFVASVARRLINPILIRWQDGDPILVAGGQRLAALIQAGIADLEEEVHFRDMKNLSPTEAKIIELEENVKRTDLSWRDHVEAVGKIHYILGMTNSNWSVKKTAHELNITKQRAHVILTVYRHLASAAIKSSSGINQAYATLQNITARQAANVTHKITETGTQIFGIQNLEKPNDIAAKTPPQEPATIIGETGPQYTTFADGGNSPAAPTPYVSPAPMPKDSIICCDFLEWIKTYTGPKFNFIHCDFPWDSPAEFKTLTETLCANIDRIASSSSHLMFWFPFSPPLYYTTISVLHEVAGYWVDDSPLFWHKSDVGAVSAGNLLTQRAYETAFLCYKGSRPLVKSLPNAYTAPANGAQKSEPMLRYFFSMLVNETTDFFDPMCGLGSSIRAAEDRGARSVLGLEIDSACAKAANSATTTARQLRKATR